jgi:hypothetical protein
LEKHRRHAQFHVQQVARIESNEIREQRRRPINYICRIQCGLDVASEK